MGRIGEREGLKVNLGDTKEDTTEKGGRKTDEKLKTMITSSQTA